MKVLIVTPHFYPAVGGLESYVLSVLRGLRDRGHEVAVVTSSDAHRELTQDTFEGSTIYYLPVQLRLSNTPVSLRWRGQLKRIIQHEAPDVINTHAPVPFMADIATFAAGHIPVVATYHAGSLLKGGGLVDVLLRAYERFVLPRVFHRTARIAAVYPEFVERIVGDDANKVAFAPPGIDTTFFTPGRVKKTTDLIFVGRVETTSTWKGIDILLQAVGLLVRSHPSISLQIVGTGDAVDAYRAQAEQLGISKHVTFAGLKKGEELVDALRGSRIIVLPSKTESESFGMVLAEAGSCGLAAVGSRVGGIPNVIEEGVTGLLAEPNNATSLATAIKTLLDDPHLQLAFGKAARERITKHYTSMRLLDTTERLLLEASKHRYPKNVQVTAHFPPSLGGMEKVAENVAIELARRGQPVEVVTSDIGANMDYRDADLPDYRVTRLSGYMIANLPVVPGLLGHLLRQPKHTLYHVHIAQAGFPEVTLLASLFRRGRVVGHFHLDVMPSSTFGKIFELYKRLIFPFMLRRMHAVIVFSDEQRRLVQSKYRVAGERVHVVPNGVSADYFREKPRAPHQPLRLLFVGRLSPQKNLPLLLKALIGTHDQLQATIVGAGELDVSLRSLAKQLGLKNVEFVGRKDGSELRAAYDHADVFVLPSEREGMPLVLLEAMAMRLPVIGTDVLGTRDLVQRGVNGQLVPLGSPEQLQRTLLALASNPKIYARLSEGAYNVASEFSWQRLIKQIETEVY